MINIFFLIVYIVFQGNIPAVMLYDIFSIHCIILIVVYLRKSSQITPLLLYYFSLIIVNYANVELIGQIGTADLQINYVIPAYVDDAALLWCISSTLTIIGYQWAINKSLPVVGFEINKKMTLHIIFWVLLMMNVSGNLNFRGGAILKALGLLNSIAVLFFARLWGRESNSRYRTYAIVLAVVQTYIALTTAFLRFDLILPTFCLGLGYFIGLGKLKYVFSYRVIPFLFVISIYSSVFRELQENRTSFISVLLNKNEAKVTGENKKNSSALLARNSNVAQMTNVINLVKRNGFYGGKISEPLLVALIPRALWPEKPEIALGQWFALAVFGDDKNFGGKSTNSINMTPAGELYLDFGWIGVTIGCILFGAIIPLLWNSARFYSSEYNLAGTIFGGYLFIFAMSSFGADLQIIITFISVYLTFLFARILLKDRI